MHLTYWCGYWCGYWCDHPVLQLSDNQWAVRRVSPAFAISAEACARTRAKSESLRANRRTLYKRSERRQRTAAVRTVYTALVVSHLTN